MFTQLFATFFSAANPSAPTSRIERDLDVLNLRHRNDVQEREARRVEEKLFFDADLLAAAKRRTGSGAVLTKTLLASIAGMLLFISPYAVHADETTNEPAKSDESTSASNEAPTLDEQLKAWLEYLGILDDTNPDPKDGEH